MLQRVGSVLSSRPKACVLLTVLAIIGCSRRETAVTTGLRTQTLHIGNSAEPPDLDPHTNNAMSVGFIGEALNEGLVRYANDGVTIKPGVAERWEISADGLRYTFHLRANALWSNGDRVTAADFVAAFRRFLEPKLGCETANIAFPIIGARDFLEGRSKDFASVGISAPDERTVEFRLRFVAPYFLAVLCNSHLVPLHGPTLDRFGGRDQRGGKWTQPGNLVSNGPFVLKAWKPQSVIVVAKNPRYWNAAQVTLNEICFYPIEDSGTEERAFRSGQLHVTYTLPFSKLPSYQQRPAAELRSTPLLRTDYITFGTGKPPFNDARLRRAFSLAIDRERLASTVLKGRGDAAFTFVRPGAGGYELPRLAQHDPAEAKRLLAEAGFPGGAGFPRLALTLSNRSEEILNYGQALQQMWRDTLGVNVELAPSELKVWLDILRNKSFTITTDNWNMGIDDPSEMLALAVTGDPNNDAGWSDARFDRAFAAIEAAPTNAARREAILACEKLIAEEAPYAPVFFGVRNNLVHPAVRGWRGNAVQTIDWTAVSLAP
jgi:oligopeptide transport system substrate-binding protein